jgi:hypothetical protein
LARSAKSGTHEHSCLRIGGDVSPRNWDAATDAARSPKIVFRPSGADARLER